MVTALSVIENGVALSAMNRPELLATNGNELVRVVDRAQVAVFAVLARLNPALIASQADVSNTGSGWARPADADAVFRIEGRGSGTTPNFTGAVSVVPWNDLAVATPAVYRLGQVYYSAGKAADPTAGVLRFYYAKRPASVSSTGATLDTLIPDTYAPIYEFEVATYLARKDGGRPNDAGVTEQSLMAAERDRWLALLADWAAHETMNEVRRFDEIPRFATEQRQPLTQGLTPAAG